MISWLLLAHTSLPYLQRLQSRLSASCLFSRRIVRSLAYVPMLTFRLRFPNSQSYFAKRTVVAEPEERKANTLMQQLHTMHANRVKKRKAKLEEKRQARQKTHSREDIRSEELAKKARKRRFVTQGQEEKKRARTAAAAERKSGGGRGQVGDGD